MKWDTWLLWCNRILDVILPPAGLTNLILAGIWYDGVWRVMLMALWLFLTIIWTNLLVSKIKEGRF